ncbi:hypothetical protein [Mycoplasma sp. VS30B]
MLFVITFSLIIYWLWFTKAKVFPSLINKILPSLIKQEKYIQPSFFKWINKQIMIRIIVLGVVTVTDEIIASLLIKMIANYGELNYLSISNRTFILVSCLITNIGSILFAPFAIQNIFLQNKLTKLRMMNASNFDKDNFDDLFLDAKDKEQLAVNTKKSKIILVANYDKETISRTKQINLAPFIKSKNIMWNYTALMFCNSYKLKDTDSILIPEMLKNFYADKIHFKKDEC